MLRKHLRQFAKAIAVRSHSRFQNFVVRLKLRDFQLLAIVGQESPISQVKSLSNRQCDVRRQFARQEDVAFMSFVRSSARAADRRWRRSVGADSVTKARCLCRVARFGNEAEELFHAFFVCAVADFMQRKLVQNVVGFRLLKVLQKSLASEQSGSWVKQYLNRDTINADCNLDFLHFRVAAAFSFLDLLSELQSPDCFFDNFDALRLVDRRRPQELNCRLNESVSPAQLHVWDLNLRT